MAAPSHAETSCLAELLNDNIKRPKGNGQKGRGNLPLFIDNYGWWNQLNDAYKAAVLERIRYRPRLTPIFTSTHDIPEQLFQYDPTFFMVYNNVKDKFEIHNLDQIGDSYCMTVPYKELDVRTIQWLWQCDIRVHGRDIFRALERDEQRMEKRKEREFKNWVEDVAKETRTMFAKDAWKFGT